MQRLSVNDFRNTEKYPVVIVLDNVRSQHNIGSVFRTADAFRVETIWLCGITATPPSREIQKTALGATESVDWKYHKSTKLVLQELKNLGYYIIGVEQTDSSILLQNFSFLKGEKYVLVFGNEIQGISEDVLEELDTCVEIPQFGTKHSFNVSVTAGIVLWEALRKML